jgi:hypothetical protein
MNNLENEEIKKMGVSALNGKFLIFDKSRMEHITIINIIKRKS